MAAGNASLQKLASCLREHSAALAQCLPGMLSAAAVKLHAAAAQLLLGCFSIYDAQAALVQTVLEGLHEALQQSKCDDGLLGGCVALRLAVMLQEQRELDAALVVVQQVRVGQTVCCSTQGQVVTSHSCFGCQCLTYFVHVLSRDKARHPCVHTPDTATP